ncbi:methylaspartate mutase [Haloechinothrix halophila]|uniref:methylaspartate mutase n=1 Tax=Haloechinothrix halophila TaxID=1069073 RepID=UPI00054FC2C3|nr:methylaspartate mutase [Haloechinothrix halophila]
MSEDRGFSGFISRARERGKLVVQPRMGFSSPVEMARGLAAVRAARALTVGTITLDSYTRTGQLDEARRALADGIQLNGYPIVTHGPKVTREILGGVVSQAFPVQVRHGSSLPGDIFNAIVDSGLVTTEGGPVSYCLPYNRTPLRLAVQEWRRCTELLAERKHAHLETFGGCMLGQLCPPSMLIALSVLEGMFFAQHGISSISLSYAQQTSAEQDREALAVLNRVASELLPGVEWHVVLYTYMGVFPATRAGALDLLGDAAMLAVRGGAERLIVKTPVETHRIPTIEENVEALEFAAAAAEHERLRDEPPANVVDTGLYDEVRALVERVLELDNMIGSALVRAFEAGYLDVPYCLHPDNRGATSSHLDSEGKLGWARTGSLPLPAVRGPAAELTSSDLLAALSYVARSYDRVPVME